MRNFLRALRLALRYRGTLLCAMSCSLLVAVFWGSNIGALYPIVEVTLQGKSLQHWAEDQIDTAQERSDKLRTRIAELRRQQAGAAQAMGKKQQAEMAMLELTMEAEQAAVATMRRFQPYLNRYFPQDPFRTVWLMVVALLVATLLKCFFLFANTLLVARLIQMVTFDLRKQFFDHVLRLDMASIGKERASGLMSRFNVDISFLTGGLSSIFDAGVREPLKLFACLIGASFISWRLLVFSLLLTPLAAFLIQRLASSIKRANGRAMEQATRLFSVLTETFNGIQVVQAFTMEKYERTRFQRVVKEGMQKSMRIVFYNALTKPVTEILGYTVIGLAFIAGAYLVLNQETHLLGIRICDRPLGFTRLLLFYAMLVGASDPVRKFSGIYNSVLGGIAAADRIYSLLDREPLIKDLIAPRAFPSPFRRLVFDHVSFHYVASQPVLRDIHIEILQGETIAMVGANGCGKTTLANLLPRFIDPVQGAVRIDDVDLRELRIRDLRRRIGMVSQHTVLFDDTVLENIRYGSPHATQQEVIEAATRAKAHEFIERDLENGYQTVVGSGGNRLSGGQRQRISLARAILRDPDILILDEATSHIDIKSEQLIHQALEQYLRGRTALIATHRLSTLALADRIVVMDAGRMLDIGTHQQLLARCAIYQRLYTVELRESA